MCAAFIHRAHPAWRAGECEVLLILVQTQHQVFHYKIVGSAEAFFLRGKIAFDRPGLPRSVAPFSNLIAIYGADQAMVGRMLATFDCVHLPRDAAVGRTGQLLR